MTGIMTWLEGLFNLITSLVNFVIGMFRDLLYVISLLGSLILKLKDMVSWLPGACISLTITAFTIVVIYKVLGREG